MPARNWRYRGLDIVAEPSMQRYGFQLWLTCSHVIAAATYSELIALIDAYLEATDGSL